MNRIKSVFSFMKLRFRASLLYPTGFVTDIIREYVNVGIWLFVALFVQKTSSSVKGAIGNYVGYMLIGVIIFQNADKLMKEPFNTLSKAFWEKRLEVYDTSDFGVFALVSGNFLYTFLFNGLIQISILLLVWPLLKAPAIEFSKLISFIIIYLLFITAIFGISLIGASTFFFLEVKQGREPVSWSVSTLVRLFSGVYYPLTLFPVYMRWIGKIFPHYYMISTVRSAIGLASGISLRNAGIIMFLFAAILLPLGIALFRKAVIFAEKRSGMSALV